MNPTKEQWAAIKKDLSRPYGSAWLCCDGYLVSTQVRISKMKLYIEVYVDGFIKGENQWTGKESKVSEMNDISRRFWCWKKHLPKAKDIKLYEAMYVKRECKKRGIYEAMIYTTPYFASPSSFIAHIKKHNKAIEVLDYNSYRTALAEKSKEAIDAT